MSPLDRTTVEAVADTLDAATNTFGDSLRRATGRPVLVAGFLVVQLAGLAAVTRIGRFGRAALALALGCTALGGLLVGGVTCRHGGRLAADGAEIDVQTTAVFRQLPALVVLSGMYAAFVVVGLLVFLFPGLYVGLRLALGFPACVIDGHGADDSLSRAWAVTGGNTAEIATVVALWLVGGGAVYSWFLLGEPPLRARTVTLLSPVTAVVSVATALSLGRLYVGYDGSSVGDEAE